MGSSTQRCSFCDVEMHVPGDGSRFNDSTCANLCDVCSSFSALTPICTNFLDTRVGSSEYLRGTSPPLINAFKGTFCEKYHMHEDGWRKCDNCEKQVHCGCVKGLQTYVMNDTRGVTCKKCLGHEILLPSKLGKSSVPDLPDLRACPQLNRPISAESSTNEEMVNQGILKPLNGDVQKPDSTTTGGNLGGEVANQGSLKPLNGEVQKPDSTTTGGKSGGKMVDQGSLKPSNGDFQKLDSTTTGGKLGQTRLYTSHTKWPNSDCVFLFQKKLTRTDCKFKHGRFQVPKKIAEENFPLPVGHNSMPIVIRDTEGRIWHLVLRWWAHKNSRKYVIDGIRRCVRTMTWNEGDTLKFYRQLPTGPFVMELIRDGASTSA